MQTVLPAEIPHKINQYTGKSVLHGNFILVQSYLCLHDHTSVVSLQNIILYAIEEPMVGTVMYCRTP